MVNNVDHQALAQYLAQVRGQNIQPSFGDGTGVGHTSTQDPDFYQRDSDYLQVEFDPFLEAEEKEEEEKERLEQEARDLAKAQQREMISFTDLEDIRNTRAERESALGADREARKQALRGELGYKKLEKDQLFHFQMGTQGSEQYKLNEVKMTEIQEFVESKMELEASNYKDQMDYINRLKVREQTLIKDTTAARKLKADKETRSYNKAEATEKLKEQALITKGITRAHTDRVKEIEGSEPTTPQIMAYSDSKLKFLKAATQAKPNALVWDASEYALGDKDAQALALKQAKQVEEDAQASKYETIAKEWAAAAELKAAEAKPVAIGTAAQKAESLKANKLKLKHKAIARLKGEYKAKNYTVNMLDPNTGNFVPQELSVAREIWEAIKLEYNGATPFSSFGYFQRSLLKQGALDSIPSRESYTYSQLEAIFNKMVDNSYGNFNTMHGKTTGILMDHKDPLVDALYH